MVVSGLAVVILLQLTACGTSEPAFEIVQPELFSAPGAQPNAWADYDNDGDLDLFVGFRGAPDRLYRNDGGVFVDVAPEVGLANAEETRVAAWGDYDRDGHLDLYVGFPTAEETPNKLFRNNGDGLSFTDVAPDLGVNLIGTTRQTSWIDYDNDGDVDLFVAFRYQANHLFRNDDGVFTDVTELSGIGDPRRTVGVAWFDMDVDGDLDAFVANQNGDQDGLFRNDGGRFVDVAAELGMDSPNRPEEHGGVGPAVADYDNDGDLDLFVANYGPDALWRNEGNGTFTEVTEGTVLGGDFHSTVAAWGDFDNDGWTDLYVASYLSGEPEAPDYLYKNVRGVFEIATPASLLTKGASHGVQWADFDADGDLDLALANNNLVGTHFLYRSLLSAADARRSIQVMVLDSTGVYTLPGAEVRVYAAGTRRLLGTRLVDTGGGYCSQNVMPVHVGVPPGINRVTVEVTVLGHDGRSSTTIEGVDPNGLPRRVLIVRLAR
ncbi:CRTAC1 family protein [Gemmatimonadota bacterium]